MSTVSSDTSRREPPPGPGASPPEPSSDYVLVQVGIENLEPDPFQPRSGFHESSIRELAASIEQHGLLQPLTVRPRQGPDSRGRYWIVAGERRYRAAKLLGLTSLPCRIQPYANLAAAVVALVENVHREDLSEIDKAEALKRIKLSTGKTWEEVAELVKLAPVYVRRLVGLLKLEEPVKEQVRRGEISARAAIALKPLPPQQQLEMARRVVAEGLTAEEIREHSRPRSASPKRPATPASFLVDAREASSQQIPLPGHPAGAEAPETEGRSPEGAVVRTLKELADQLQQASSWLAQRDWSSSKVSPEQEEQIHRLYHAASQLQQQAAYIRMPLKDRKESDAEKLRKAPLPF